MTVPERDSDAVRRPSSRWRPDRDLVVSVAAVFLSLCALGVSLAQTAVMRAQQHASVWPRLTTAVDVDADTVALTVRNAGVGPAQIVWAELLLDGAPIDGWATLLKRATVATPSARDEHSRVHASSLSDDVLVPGERKVVFGVDGALARAVTAMSGRVGLRVCYCSVFDRCWRLENAQLAGPSSSDRIVPVPRCDRPATPLI